MNRTTKERRAGRGNIQDTSLSTRNKIYSVARMWSLLGIYEASNLLVCSLEKEKERRRGLQIRRPN